MFRRISWDFVLLFGICIIILWRMRNFLLDDAFFGFNYAQNLALGQGLVFNSGERIIGTSSPLVAIVYGLLFYLTKVDVIIWAKVIGSIFFVLLVVFSYLIFQFWLGKKFWAFIGVMFFILYPLNLFLFSHESLIYLSLAIISLHLWAKDKKDLANIFMGAGVLIRQEMVILWLVLMSEDVLLLLKQKFSFKLLLKRSVIFSLCWAWWFIFSKYYFGNFFSNSFYSKHVQTQLGVQNFIKGFILYNLDLVKTYKLSFFYFSGVSLLVVTFFKKVVLDFKKVRLTLIWIVLLTFFYIAINMPFYHWFTPQIFLLFAMVYSFSGKEIFSNRQDHRWGRVIKPVYVLIILVAFLGMIGLTIKSTSTMPDNKHSLYKDIGIWLNQNTLPSSTVLYGEVGIIKYYSQRTIIDYIGMVTPKALPFMIKRDFKGLITQFKPDYVIYNEAFATLTGTLPKLEWFNKNYLVVKIFENNQEIYKTYIYQRSLEGNLADYKLD